MSLRPQAEAPDLDSALNNAFQIRCTIQAARAAHAQFEPAHGHEHECVDTAVKSGKQPVRGRPKASDQGVQDAGVEKKKDARSIIEANKQKKNVFNRLGTSPQAVPGPAASGPGSSAQAPLPAIAKKDPPFDSFPRDHEDTLPDPIMTKILNGTDQKLPFVLIDGRNLFFKAAASEPVPKWDELIKETKKHLPVSTNRAGQVIVVWTMLKWKEFQCDRTPYKRQRLAQWLKDLAFYGTNVVFLLVDFDKAKLNQVYYKKCSGRVQEDGDGGKSCDIVDKWERNVSDCQIAGMRDNERSHLACELDDVLLSALNNRLTKANRVVQVVSLDKSILKNPLDIKAVVGWLNRDAAQDFEMEVVIAEVPLTWP